jgi:hypothetical protein
MRGIMQFRRNYCERRHRVKVQGTMLLKHNASHAHAKPPNFAHIRCATPLGDAVSVQHLRSQRLRNFAHEPFAHYGELFKTSEPNEPVVRAVFGLSVSPSVRENERRKQGSKVYGQKDDGVGAV